MFGMLAFIPAAEGILGAICFWLVIFFPFAIWCRRIARPDALNGIESYLLGQSCGPVGVWLVMRANKRALEREYLARLHVEQLKVQDGPAAGVSPEEVRRRNLEHGAPMPSELPGGLAFRAPAQHHPKAAAARMDTVKLDREPAPAEPAPAEPAPDKAPLEPQLPPPTKAAGAFRVPVSDPKFTHSDETDARGGGETANDYNGPTTQDGTKP